MTLGNNINAKYFEEFFIYSKDENKLWLLPLLLLLIAFGVLFVVTQGSSISFYLYYFLIIMFVAKYVKNKGIYHLVNLQKN